MKTVHTMLATTTLGIKLAQDGTCPQGRTFSGSCSFSGSIRKAGLRTALQMRQVLDKKGENSAVHSAARPLSTTANLN
jgi:hypothetical protein